MAKDPKRQLLGKIARQKGQYFEQRLDGSFDYYPVTPRKRRLTTKARSRAAGQS